MTFSKTFFSQHIKKSCIVTYACKHASIYVTKVGEPEVQGQVRWAVRTLIM